MISIFEFEALVFLWVSFILGFLMTIHPYLFIPTQTVQKFSLWGDPSKQPGLVTFTMKSKGALTANYPIDLEVEISKARDVKQYFQVAKKMEIIIPDSYEYPMSKNGGRFSAGKVSISPTTGMGKARILFPYAGAFSTYHIFVDDKPVWAANFPKQSEPTIFVIENYGVRLQIENSRNLGVAIMSLSIAALGLLLGIVEW